MWAPHSAAGRLHLDTLWWTAGAETSERGIYRRAFRARSSRLPSLPQASRSYDLPPPMPRLAHSGCPQSRASLPPAAQFLFFPTPTVMRRSHFDPPSCSRTRHLCLSLTTVFHAKTATIDGDHLRMV